MSDYNHPLFKKLDRIPGAPNFVRYNFQELVKTLKAYVAFAKGMPTVSYAQGLTLIKALVLGESDATQIKRAARRIKESPSKSAIIEFVDAFCLYAEERNTKRRLFTANSLPHSRSVEIFLFQLSRHWLLVKEVS